MAYLPGQKRSLPQMTRILTDSIPLKNLIYFSSSIPLKTKILQMPVIKYLLCFSFLCLLMLLASAQDSTWINHSIDKLVQVSFPGEIETSSTSVGELESTLFSTQKGSSTFQVQKTILEADSVAKQESDLPFDENSLLKVYQKMTTDFATANAHTEVQQQKIVKDDLIGYQFTLLNDKGKPTAEGHIFLLNKAVYSFIYLDESAFSEADKTAFFDSISFAESKEIEQMEGTPFDYKLGYFIGRWGLYILVGVVLVAYLLRQSRRGAIRP